MNSSNAIDHGDLVQQKTEVLVTDSLNWMLTDWFQIMVAAGIAAGIVLILYALRSCGAKLVEKTEGPSGWGLILSKTVSKTGSFFIIMVSAKLVSGYADPPATVAKTIDFLFTVAAVFQAAIWARELILGAIEKKTESDNYQGEALLSALGLIRLLVTVVLFAIALVVVLDNLGVNVTGLIAGFGVGGIAIGLAAQGIFADLFAALAIIFDKPFRRGDKVQYDQTTGVIESIGLKSTRVRSFDGEERVIANKQLLDKEIQNTSRRDHVRIRLPIGVAYETPPERLEALPEMLREIVEEAGGLVARASYDGFGASSIDFVLQFDIQGDDWPLAHQVRDKVIIGIIRRFASEGIAIPYPTQTTFTADPSGKLILPYPDHHGDAPVVTEAKAG